MKLGAQFVEKSFSTSNIISAFLTYSFCLMSLILPRFHNHVFHINFVLLVVTFFKLAKFIACLVSDSHNESCCFCAIDLFV